MTPARALAVDLRHILQPVGVEPFIEKHWAKRALYIPGDPAKFRDLRFDRDVLRALWSGSPPPELIKAHYFDADNVSREVSIEPHQVEPFFRAGMTICLVHLDDLHPELARCAGAVKLALNYPDRVAVSSYYSPDGSGVGVHFDSHSIFILQIEGEKRWRYSTTPVVPFPPRNLPFDGRESFSAENPWARLEMPDEASLEEQVLRPGDVLYMPPGTCHRTYAKGYSLSLSVVCWRTNFLDLLWQHLAPTMRQHAAWRQPVPVFTERRFWGIPFPAATETFIAARLAELRELVNGWTPATFASTFFSSVSEFNLPPDAVERRARVRRTDSFEVPHPLTCVPVQGEGADEKLHLFAGNRRLSMPLTASRFIERLGHRKRFTAIEALGWDDARGRLEWSEVREALETLVDSGIIRPTRPLRPKATRRRDARRRR
jgi:ribosomal protein L16 Arg81 hydroxylase